MPSTKNFHVPLSEELYSKLRKEAERSQESATEIARKAIASWLKEKEKEAIHQAVLSYARKNAGSSNDLDEELEKSATNCLLKEKALK